MHIGKATLATQNLGESTPVAWVTADHAVKQPRVGVKELL
jgi:hypothetical protein